MQVLIVQYVIDLQVIVMAGALPGLRHVGHALFRFIPLSFSPCTFPRWSDAIPLLFLSRQNLLKESRRSEADVVLVGETFDHGWQSFLFKEFVTRGVWQKRVFDSGDALESIDGCTDLSIWVLDVEMVHVSIGLEHFARDNSTSVGRSSGRYHSTSLHGRIETLVLVNLQAVFSNPAYPFGHGTVLYCKFKFLLYLSRPQSPESCPLMSPISGSQRASHVLPMGGI